MGSQPDLARTSLPPFQKLTALRDRIAALRVQAEAAKLTAGVVGEMLTTPIFDWPVSNAEVMCADRDVSRRDEKILSVLRERGPNRVLGAVANEAMAEKLGSLYESHPNFRQATDYVLGEEILTRQRLGAICGLRLLLQGGAGVGKTDYALALAKHLSVPGEVISLSSAQAAAYLAGSEAYWSNSQPGVVWKYLVQGSHANPMIVLDEIDKVTDRWGDPLGALYQLLEPKSAAIFADKSVPWLPINAAHVNWVATANDPQMLHPAIRSRFFEVEVGMPPQELLSGLVQRLYTNLLSEFGVANQFPLALDEHTAKRLAKGSIRDSKRILRTALAQALRQGTCSLSVPEQVPSAVVRNPIGFV